MTLGVYDMIFVRTRILSMYSGRIGIDMPILVLGCYWVQISSTSWCIASQLEVKDAKPPGSSEEGADQIGYRIEKMKVLFVLKMFGREWLWRWKEVKVSVLHKIRIEMQETYV